MASPTQYKVRVRVGGKTRLIAQFADRVDAINYADARAEREFRLRSLNTTVTVHYGGASSPWCWKARVEKGGGLSRWAPRREYG